MVGGNVSRAGAREGVVDFLRGLHHPRFLPPPPPQDISLYAALGPGLVPPCSLAADLAATPCPALGRLQSLSLSVPSLPADTLQVRPSTPHATRA